MKRDFNKLVAEGETSCSHYYELLFREMVFLMEEGQKGSHELFVTISKAFYAGFASGQRCLRAQQKRLEKISKSSPKVPQIVE